MSESRHKVKVIAMSAFNVFENRSVKKCIEKSMFIDGL